MRTPPILEMLAPTLRAWWDDVHFASGRRSPTTRCLRSRQFSSSPPQSEAWSSAPTPCAGNRGSTRSPGRRRGGARCAEPSGGVESATSRDPGDRAWRHHLCHRCDRRLPRTPERTQHDLARQAEIGRPPPRIGDRSPALIRPGGGDRLSADGLTHRDGGPVCTERMAHRPLLECPAGMARRQHGRVGRGHHRVVRPTVPLPARRASALASCDDGRIRDRGALHDRSTADWSVSGTEHRGLELRRGWFRDDPAALGLLLVPVPAVRRRVHARLLRAPGCEPRPESFAEKDPEAAGKAG
jgi:hypothetical protein